MCMDKIQIWQSLLIGVWVWLVMSRVLFGQATQYLRNSGLMTGLVVGLILGDVTMGITIAASIQLMYMGMVGPGGTQPSEPSVATAVAVPTAILGGLSATQAITIAIPIGILGAYLYTLRTFLNTFIYRIVDKNASNINDKGLTLSIIALPLLASFILYVPVIFLSVQYGAPLIANWLSTAASESLLHVLGTIGGGLAAVGIASAVYVISRHDYLPFFVLFYFGAVLAPQVNSLVWAIVATCIAIIYVVHRNETKNLIS